MTNPKTIRLKTWEEFKELAHTKNPLCVVYVIAQSIPNRNYTGLRLILAVEGAQYVFLDSANGDYMRRTKIPIRTGNKGIRLITDDDIKRFIRTELNINESKIFSYWTA